MLKNCFFFQTMFEILFNSTSLMMVLSHSIIIILMEMDKKSQMSELSKKYNLEALQDYNFDNFSFDIDFGDMSQKDVDKMKQEEKEYNEELKKKEAEKKKGK